MIIFFFIYIRVVAYISGIEYGYLDPVVVERYPLGRFIKPSEVAAPDPDRIRAFESVEFIEAEPVAEIIHHGFFERLAVFEIIDFDAPDR